MSDPLRTDLLALTRQSLEDLANRGLVKRAIREVESGGPSLTEDDNGTVTGLAGDVTTVLRPGVSLPDTECSCGASGICRHRLAVVLAYQGLHSDKPPAGEGPASDESGSAKDGSAADLEPAPPTFEQWSPGGFSDDDLVEKFGRNALNSARRMSNGGHLATIRRPTQGDPTPTVELENATVRFLVPRDLNYVSTSARGTDAAPLTILAVWAFRRADEESPNAEHATVDVRRGVDQSIDLSSVTPALSFADQVLLDGVATIQNVELTTEKIGRDLEKHKMRWPLAAVDDLVEQLNEYRSRGALYEPGETADLIAELHARHRSAAGEPDTPRARILGTTEASETAMRHLRLDGLGCRISGQLEDRRVDIFFAHADAATVYVIRRRNTFDDLASAPSAEGYANRTGAAKATIRALSNGNIITSAARRKANREIRIGRSTVAQTSVVPSGAAWEKMAEPLRVNNLDRLTRSMAKRPPRLVRARVLAESLHAVEIGEVLDVRYRPGAQKLQAVIADPHGTHARVELVHRSVAPGALDALYRALAEDDIRFISGFVRGQGDAIAIEPVGVGTDRLTALDTAPEQDSTLPPGRVEPSTNPHLKAIDAALDQLADGLHRGLRNVAPGFSDRLRRSARGLQDVGLRTTSDSVKLFAERLDQFGASGQSPPVVQAWVDARIRLLIAAEMAGAA